MDPTNNRSSTGRKPPRGGTNRGLSLVFQQEDGRQDSRQDPQESRLNSRLPHRSTPANARINVDSVLASRSISSHLQSSRTQATPDSSRENQRARDHIMSSRRPPSGFMGNFSTPRPGGEFPEPRTVRTGDTRVGTSKEAMVNEVFEFLRENGFFETPGSHLAKLPRSSIPSVTDIKLMLNWMYLRIDPNFHRGMNLKDHDSGEILEMLDCSNKNEIRRALNGGVFTPITWQRVLAVMLEMKKILEWIEESQNAVTIQMTESQVIDKMVEDYVLETYDAGMRGDKDLLERYENELELDLERYTSETRASLAAAEAEMTVRGDRLQELRNEELRRERIDQSAKYVEQDLAQLENHIRVTPLKIEQLKNKGKTIMENLEAAGKANANLKKRKSNLQALMVQQGISMDEVLRYSRTWTDLQSELANLEEINAKRLATLKEVEDEADIKLKEVGKLLTEFNELGSTFDIHIELDDPFGKSLGVRKASFLLRDTTLDNTIAKILDTKSTIDKKVLKLRMDVKELEYEINDFKESEANVVSKVQRTDMELKTLKQQYENVKADYYNINREIEEQRERALDHTSKALHAATERNTAVRAELTTEEEKSVALHKIIDEELQPRVEKVKAAFLQFSQAFGSLGTNLQEATRSSQKLMQELTLIAAEAESLEGPDLDADLDVLDVAELAQVEAQELFTQYLGHLDSLAV